MDGWMIVGTDGCMDVCMYVHMYVCTHIRSYMNIHLEAANDSRKLNA